MEAPIRAIHWARFSLARQEDCSKWLPSTRNTCSLFGKDSGSIGWWGRVVLLLIWWVNKELIDEVSRKKRWRQRLQYLPPLWSALWRRLAKSTARFWKNRSGLKRSLGMEAAFWRFVSYSPRWRRKWWRTNWFDHHLLHLNLGNGVLFCLLVWKSMFKNSFNIISSFSA